MHKVQKGKVSSIKNIDGKDYWLIKDDTTTPSIFEIKKFPDVKIGDIVKVIWRKHYGEETRLVVVDHQEYYEPKEGF